MKRLLILLFSFCMLFLMAACSSDDNAAKGHEEHSMQIWYNANCKAPRTCGICGYTEGGLGDHSVKVGTCHHCNEFQNKEMFDGIKSDLTELTVDLKEAHDFLQEKANDPASDEFVYAAAIETVAPTFDAEKSKLEDILKLCEKYEELDGIKRDVETSLEYFPVKPSGTSLEESREYITDTRMCYLYILEALNSTTYIS